MTIEDLKTWLTEVVHQDRPWLAEELGVSKRTVDNWFTENKLPRFAIQHLKRIMADDHSPGKLRFTLHQWDAIEAARKSAGFTDRTAFFTAALTEYAKSLTQASPLYERQRPHVSDPTITGNSSRRRRRRSFGRFGWRKG